MEPVEAYRLTPHGQTLEPSKYCLQCNRNCCRSVCTECSSQIINVILLIALLVTLPLFLLICLPNAILLYLLYKCWYQDDDFDHGLPCCPNLCWCDKKLEDMTNGRIELLPRQLPLAVIVPFQGVEGAIHRSADPQMCVLTCETSIEVNTETAVALETYNSEGISCRDTQIHASLRSLLNHKLWFCNIIELKTASEIYKYVITFSTDTRGRHDLSVKVAGEHIRGSPFRIFSQLTPISLGKPVRVIRGLKHPLSVAFGQNSERIIVAEFEANRVSVMDRNGTRLKYIKHPVLQAPTGVIIDNHGSLYVTTKRHILKFSSIGILTRVIAHTVASIDLPVTVKHRTDEKLYICNPSTNSITIFNTDLIPTGTIPQRGNNYQTPYSIAFNEITTQMFVSDPENRTIQVLDRDGFKQNDIPVNTPWIPHRICVSIQTRLIYVTDCNNHYVLIYHLSTGEYVHCFGGEGRKPGMFNHPTGIAVDDDGFVYVCDTGNNRIQVF